MEKLFCLSPPLWKEMFVSTRWKRCLVTLLSWFLATSVTRPKGSKNGEVYVFYVCMEKNKVRSKSGNSGYNAYSLISNRIRFFNSIHTKSVWKSPAYSKLSSAVQILLPSRPASRTRLSPWGSWAPRSPPSPHWSRDWMSPALLHDYSSLWRCSLPT